MAKRRERKDAGETPALPVGGGAALFVSSVPAWFLLLVFLIGCSPDGSAGKTQWPTRPIRITCFSSPGGGTDTVDRTIAKAMGRFWV